MSETTVAQSLATISNWRLGSVGKCIHDSLRLKIDNPDGNGEGEVSAITDINAGHSPSELLPIPLAIAHTKRRESVQLKYSA